MTKAYIAHGNGVKMHYNRDGPAQMGQLTIELPGPWPVLEAWT
jgi:hypothetical protein